MIVKRMIKDVIAIGDFSIELEYEDDVEDPFTKVKIRNKDFGILATFAGTGIQRMSNVAAAFSSISDQISKIKNKS